MLPWFHSVCGACFFCFILPSLLNLVLIAIIYRKLDLPQVRLKWNFTHTDIYLSITKLQSIFFHIIYRCSFFLSWRISPISGSLWQGFLYSVWIPFKQHANTSSEKEQMKQSCILIFNDPPELPSFKSVSSELRAVSP